MSAYFFLHCPSGQTWPTDDPHRWLLDHRDDEILAAVRERLLASPDDHERCLRVALRRCCLVLIQIIVADKIVVRHWRDPTPDLRGWAKRYGFNRTGVQVVFDGVKIGKVVVPEYALNLLVYGERVSDTFLWREYTTKYERRDVDETDDDDVAPASATKFIWANCSNERLTWQVLKAIWRAETVLCQNCDRPLILVGFEWHKGPLSFRSARLHRYCLVCRRRFDVAEETPLAWIAAVLPRELRPAHLRLWGTIPINWCQLSLGRARTVQLANREG